MYMEITHRSIPTFVGVSVVFDKAHNRIHVLDCGEGMTVTNSIELIREPILVGLMLEGMPEQYEWILYHTDGTITEFQQTFYFVSLDDKRLHVDFAELMPSRAVISQTIIH